MIEKSCLKRQLFFCGSVSDLFVELGIEFGDVDLGFSAGDLCPDDDTVLAVSEVAVAESAVADGVLFIPVDEYADRIAFAHHFQGVLCVDPEFDVIAVISVHAGMQDNVRRFPLGFEILVIFVDRIGTGPFSRDDNAEFIPTVVLVTADNTVLAVAGIYVFEGGFHRGIFRECVFIHEIKSSVIVRHMHGDASAGGVDVIDVGFPEKDVGVPTVGLIVRVGKVIFEICRCVHEERKGENENKYKDKRNAFSVHGASFAKCSIMTKYN